MEKKIVIGKFVSIESINITIAKKYIYVCIGARYREVHDLDYLFNL